MSHRGCVRDSIGVSLSLAQSVEHPILEQAPMFFELSEVIQGYY